uniref:hypothetical protein n=1 Tax=Sulfuriferula sp. GW6 TaxID=3345112 RepID=UPI0039F66464
MNTFVYPEMVTLEFTVTKEEAERITRAWPSLLASEEAPDALPPGTNPFAEHRELLLHPTYGTAHKLQQAMLSFWNGNGYPFALHNVQGMDQQHYQIFQDMLAWYRAHGERCKVFMALAQEVADAKRAATEG